MYNMYLCQTFLILVSSSTIVRSEIWKSVDYPQPIEMLYTKTFPALSVALCIRDCRPYSESLLVAVKDGSCFCLTSDFPSTSTKGPVNVSSLYLRLAEIPDCLNEGYAIHHDLKICTKLILDMKIWESAKKYCNQDGGYLINVDTQEKFNIVTDYSIQSGTKRISIGGYDMMKHGTGEGFRWTRGKPFYKNSTLWKDGEPNNTQGVEFCIRFFQNLSIIDHSCNVDDMFICEKLLM